MTKVADCDLVFDVLTRGPFPSGDAHDAIVEQHLAACHECRQLAEALRPSVDLFHEALDASADGLPGYYGPADERMVEAVMTAVSSGDEVETTEASKRKWRRSGVLPLLAIVVSLTMFLALTTAPGAKEPQPGGRRAVESDIAARYQPNVAGRELLSALLVGERCLPARQPAKPSPADSLAYRCCTDCHSASIKQPVEREFPWTRFLRSCGACHDHLAMSWKKPAEHACLAELVWRKSV